MAFNNTSYTGGSMNEITNTTLSYPFTREIQSFEVPVSLFFLLLIFFVGTTGNFLIIYAVTTQKDLRKLSGNAFICNLAVADLMVTALVIPFVCANVINNNESVLTGVSCRVLGFIMPLSCVASMQNLMFISIHRYVISNPMSRWAGVLNSRFAAFGSIVFVWLWSIAMISPTVIQKREDGSDLLIYDYPAGMCGWDDISVTWYPIALIVVAFFIPLLVMVYCYYRMFQIIKRSTVEMSRETSSSTRQMQEREKRLLKTILIVLAFYLLSWSPYCIMVLLRNFNAFDELTLPMKRPVSWLALSNSMANSMIYGWRQKSFREGYLHFFLRLGDIFTCYRLKLQQRETQGRRTTSALTIRRAMINVRKLENNQV